MRVTRAMMASQVVFNMQRSLTRFIDLQGSMSSGRRINKPSDDPLGIVRDLDYRRELASTAQYRRNVSQARNWMQNYEAVLSEVWTLVDEAHQEAVGMADGHMDADARMAAAQLIEATIDQLMNLANSELEGKSVFSGFNINAPALRNAAAGATYAGDSGRIEFQVETSARMQVNLNGDEVFLKPLSVLGKNGDLNVAVTGTTLLTDLHAGGGINQLPGTITIEDQNLNIISTIDLSQANGILTVNDAVTEINTQLAVDGITNLTVQISPSGNGLLFDTTENGLISTSTAVSVLNGGNGVDLSPGFITLSDGGAITLDIDLSGSANISDILSKFNAAIAASSAINGVSMQINAAGTGLEINDSNGPPPLGLTVSNFGDGSTASNLGLTGPIGTKLVGTDLDPVVSFNIAESGGTTAADLGIRDVFNNDFIGSDLDPKMLATTKVADLNGGSGFSLGKITVAQGERTVILDLGSPAITTVQDVLDLFNNSGLAITASVNSAGSGIQIVNDDPTRSFTITDTLQGGRLTKDLDIYGSSDMMGSLTVLLAALRTNDQEGVGKLIGNLELASTHVLNQRAMIGAKGVRLESTDSRLNDLELSFTRLLSEVEDADLTRLVTDLATYENSYTASLMATAKIIQPTLLDFLR